MDTTGRGRQNPLMFHLISVFFDDRDQEESDAGPISNRSVLLLMLLAGAGAVLYGWESGLLNR